MSLLTRKGYTIGIDELTELDIDELTVTPKAFHPDPFGLRAQGRSEPLRTFEVFLDNDEGTVAVPRYWGEHKFGLSGKGRYPSTYTKQIIWRSRVNWGPNSSKRLQMHR